LTAIAALSQNVRREHDQRRSFTDGGWKRQAPFHSWPRREVQTPSVRAPFNTLTPKRKILRVAVLAVEYHGRKTVTVYDVVWALNKKGRPVYGFGHYAK
nr:hypothetical protein [Tanacetum cinerariifolium]